MGGKNLILRLREWYGYRTSCFQCAAETEKVPAHDAGTNDYVAKPFGINELMARIRVELRSNQEISASPTVLEAQGRVWTWLIARCMSTGILCICQK